MRSFLGPPVSRSDPEGVGHDPINNFCHRCSHTLDDETRARCPTCGAPRPTSAWPVDGRLGQTVVGGQYRVLRRMGAGGFGVVYEAVVLERVNHPNVARCYAVGTLEDESALYLLLELVTGTPVSALLGADGDTGSRRARAFSN